MGKMTDLKLLTIQTTILRNQLCLVQLRAELLLFCNMIMLVPELDLSQCEHVSCVHCYCLRVACELQQV